MKLFDPFKDVVYTHYFVEERINDLVGPFRFPSIVIENHLGEPGSRTKYYNHFFTGSKHGSYYASYFDSNITSENKNGLWDLTVGTHPSSSFVALHDCGFLDIKKKVYRLFAQKLLGNANSVFTINGKDRHDLIFILLKRNHLKQGIKPGTFSMYGIYSGSYVNLKHYSYAWQDGLNKYAFRADEFGGETEELRRVIGLGDPDDDRYVKVFYDQGVIVCDVEFFGTGSGAGNLGNFWLTSGSSKHTFNDVYITTGSLDFNSLLIGCMQRQYGMSFTNYSKARATIFTCKAAKDEFNYSSNPSFVNNFGEIITASGSENLYPTTYITKVGLLGENNELIAVGNLNKPVKKDFDRDITIKVRLDY